MSDFGNIINGNKPVLVDFYATWCGPCKMQDPILKEVKKEMGDNARIIKIDVDKNPEAASQFNVQSVPTLILFKEGKIVWRESGVASKEKIKNLFQEHN